MSCILDQSVWSKMKLLLICAVNKNFIWSLCSAAFLWVPSNMLCPSSAVEYGQGLWLPFNVPRITHLASLSTHTYTYSQSISSSLCLWIPALLCSDLTKLRDNTEIHCYISPFPSPTSPLVTNLNFTISSRGHILLQKACSPHRLRLARFAVAYREWATPGNTTPLGETPDGSDIYGPECKGKVLL